MAGGGDGFMDAVRRVALTWSINLLNLLVFIFSYGNLTLHEGRVYSFGKTPVWANWSFFFFCKPQIVALPTSQQEICDYVRKAKKVRVVAGGHSFNPGSLSEDTLISLDKYKEVEEFNKTTGLITVQAGLRLRELITIIEKAGWDLPVMGTANTQSIGGLVASDLHATGRESGYLSQQIKALRIINSQGKAETFQEDSDVFKSAIGGIGAMGVVVAVTIQLVKLFNVRRVTTYVNRNDAEKALLYYLNKHEHVGFFYIGGLRATKLRLTTYDRALPYETKTPMVYFRIFCAQIFDLLNGGFFLDFAPYIPGFLNFGYFIWNNTFLSEPFIDTAGPIFTSKLFFRHDEMEYAMPFGNFQSTIDSLMNYLDSTGTVALMEVRFTIGSAQTKALLGPGAGRDTCFIEILPTLTHNTRRIFAATENFFAKNDGRPHLGKFTTYNKSSMVQHYGEAAVNTWLKARESQDPERKFVNSFVNQVFFDESPWSPSQQAY